VRRQRGGVLRAILLVLLGLGVLGALAAALIVREGRQRIEAQGPLEEPAIVWVERGDTVRAVIGKLEGLGALEGGRADLLFRIEARLQELAPSLHAGEFEIPARASIAEIVETLKEGDPILRFVTIPEGLTTAQALRLIAAAPVLEGEITLSPEEGALLPETYAYQRGEDRDAVVRRIMAAHDEALQALWPNRAQDLPFDTQEEAVILASIVEKETAVPSERPRVAAVFVNRLRRGMRLQSDPTIIYGLTGGEPLGRGIRQSELQGETPYNTYVIRGLPPTPIANPGKASLAAVLNPAQTDDLYFVADGSGGHAFAGSLAEHNRNVAAWRRIERQRASGGGR